MKIIKRLLANHWHLITIAVMVIGTAAFLTFSWLGSKSAPQSEDISEQSPLPKAAQFFSSDYAKHNTRQDCWVQYVIMDEDYGYPAEEEGKIVLEIYDLSDWEYLPENEPPNELESYDDEDSVPGQVISYCGTTLNIADLFEKDGLEFKIPLEYFKGWISDFAPSDPNKAAEIIKNRD